MPWPSPTPQPSEPILPSFLAFSYESFSYEGRSEQLPLPPSLPHLPLHPFPARFTAWPPPPGAHQLPLLLRLHSAHRPSLLRPHSFTPSSQCRGRVCIPGSLESCPVRKGQSPEKPLPLPSRSPEAQGPPRGSLQHTEPGQPVQPSQLRVPARVSAWGAGREGRWL